LENFGKDSNFKNMSFDKQWNIYYLIKIVNFGSGIKSFGKQFKY